MAIDALPSSPRPARLEVLGRLGLHDGSGEEVTAILKGAKRLALLSYLVLARGDGFHRRDRLLALFWPESPADQARGSLRQALHSLRRSLGPGVIEGRGDEELRADPALIWCDALEFERLAQPGREVEALRLYRGPLLDGFHAPDVSPEFERWLEAERDRLNRLAVTLAWQRAASCEREGSPLEAARWARHAVALLPDDEPGVRRLMQLLDRLGDRAGALAAYADFTTRLRAEYDSDAAPETRRLAAEFRRRASPARPSPEPVLPARVPSAPVAAPRPGPRPGRALLAAGCLLAVTLGAGLWVRLRATAPVPVLAVGAIGEPSVPDSAHLAQSIPDLLATNLARLPDVRVVSRIRL
ncbi:MAG TPA: BTAD domain-containing putative transcriptional regulator, partial [Gemmatimonadales bacterium]|nr:BTAD domain-containing putative transcriptional regulator [Gemmatimonadales bacterium]